MFPVTKYCICHKWKSVTIRRDVKYQRTPLVFLNELQTKPLGILGTSLGVQYFPVVEDALELGRFSLFPGQYFCYMAVTSRIRQSHFNYRSLQTVKPYAKTNFG